MASAHCLATWRSRFLRGLAQRPRSGTRTTDQDQRLLAVGSVWDRHVAKIRRSASRSELVTQDTYFAFTVICSAAPWQRWDRSVATRLPRHRRSCVGWWAVDSEQVEQVIRKGGTAGVDHCWAPFSAVHLSAEQRGRSGKCWTCSGHGRTRWSRPNRGHEGGRRARQPAGPRLDCARREVTS